MKLPFDFAAKFILRLVLPGALFTALLWPIVLLILRILRLDVPDAVSVPIAILLFGWMILLADMPIYMLFEGRRFWPDWLRRWGVTREQARLRRLQKAYGRTEAAGDVRAAAEAELKIRSFPLSTAGIPEALYPTRLGNLITAFETYPDRKYGIDGVFGWGRLWVTIDKDLRAELDDQQAMVDSGLYAVCVLHIGAVICLGYAVMARCWPTILRELPGSRIMIELALACLLAGRLLARVSEFAHRQYGELFASVFDQFHSKLEFAPLVDELALRQSDPGLVAASVSDRNRAAVRFLKWHRYRRVGSTANVIVSDW